MSQKDVAFKEKENKSKTSNVREKIPYKLFGKRIFKTSGRLVASTQLLQNPIPTQDCDIIVTFPRNADTSTLMWLLDRLRSRSHDIIVHVRHHSNTKEAVFHLTANYESLLKGAEDVSIKKTLKDDYGGGMKEFTFEDQDCFAGVEDETNFFTTQERQIIIGNMLNNLRALKGEQLNKVKFLEGQPIVPLLQSKGIVSQVFPLHNQDSLQELRKEWVQGLFKRQPLDKIRNYYGVKISMYFAYLGHYTMALCIPAFLGAGIWFFQGEDETYDDQWFVAFALFNAFWATLYLEHWKRRSSELAYNWGTLDKMDELLEDPRPLFTGSLQESPVTGRLEPHYSAWKRNLFRYFISLPIICLCLCVVFIVMLLIFELQEWTNSLVKAEDIPGFCKFLPKILLAISIGILDEIYKKIAHWLNNMENYRLDHTYENHLIIKLALFQFVNSFLSLFYIAFYLQDMDRLRDQLAAILITRQVIGNIKEALLPYLLWRAKLYKVGFQMTSDLTPSTPGEKIISVTANDKTGELRERKKENNKDEKTTAEEDKTETQKPKCPSLTQGEVESTMKKYEDTFEDYLEMFIQFGYVTLFSSAFPLAALCALLNNVVEIRSDAFKLCMNHQRPFGKQVENIGSWQDALELMGVIAVIVNCALIGVSGQVTRLVPNSSILLTVLLIVALEHVILMLKFILAYAIPDVPDRIATKKARLEFLRREALKKLELQISPNNNSSTDTRHRQKHKTEGRSYCQTVTANCSQNIGDFRLITPTELPSRSSPQIISITGSGSDQKPTHIPIPTQGSLIIKTPVKTTSTFVSKVTIGPRKNVTSSANMSSASTNSFKAGSPSRDKSPNPDSQKDSFSVDGYSNNSWYSSSSKNTDSKIPVPIQTSSV